ncbi:unnamed protein product [Linum tenue]|uniref:RPW8 domain-containing protein n=1 Tax=Linum tenue TaxID=586396 RepID=A0AAV0R9W6_9ROSI|nr:unnamed protein product [Linum tenue]
MSKHQIMLELSSIVQAMAQVVQDAFIGAVMGELLKAVLEAQRKAAAFKPTLQEIESTLETIIPIAAEIQELSEVLHQDKREIEPLMQVIREGKDLVLKCSRIRWYTCWKKPSYKDKLDALEGSLKSYLDLVLQLQMARDIKKNLVEVKKVQVMVLDRGRRAGLEGYFLPAAIPNPVGFQVPLWELKMEFFKDDTSLLVLSAPPGCGKTTLATLFCHDKDVQERFKDNIFFIRVSKKQTMESVVQRMYMLKGHRDPVFQGEEDAHYHLENLLKSMGSNPILLVLDDVWPETVYILDKLKFNIPGFKVLVTSRSVYPKYKYQKLNPLNDKDSRTLFDNSAFLPDQPKPDIPKDVINQIVKECKGFPLALTVVGRSLCGEPIEVWRTRAMALSEAGPVMEGGELYSELYSCLEKSLDALDKQPKVKQCFMDLALFPEDDLIPAAALIDMWSELYKLDEDGLQAVANLYQLSARNLADLVVTRRERKEPVLKVTILFDRTDAEGYNHHFVTQHDLLRELIIYQSSLEPIEQRDRLIVEIFRNQVPDWCTERKQLSIHCRILSISTDEKFSSSSWRIQAPELQVMVLNFRTKTFTLPKFMTGSNENPLEVLILRNYGVSPADVKNFPQLLSSLSTLKKIRLEQISIPPSLFTTFHFQTLEKITIVLCRVTLAFNPSSSRISQPLPNLKEINIDYCKDLVELPIEICKLTNLKKLRITNCHNLAALPDEIGSLKNLEELTLSSCIGLSELPEAIGYLGNLRSLDISECADVRKLPEAIGELGKNLKRIQMMGCSKNFWVPDSVLKLENLEEVGCDEDTAPLWEPFVQVMKRLKVKVRKEEINLNWLHGGRF